jgi:hypothetical protein
MRPPVVGAALVGCLMMGAATSAQRSTDAERAAALIVRWKQIVYSRFEEARAYVDEENSDAVNAILSQGAVRAVQDRVDAPGLQRIDGTAGRMADAIVKAGKRQPGGSLILDAESREKGLDVVCPVYPFCAR